MPCFKLCLTLSTALLLVSCASNEALTNKTEFKTRITNNGLKHFQLSLVQRKRNPEGSPQMGPPPERRQGQRPKRSRGAARKQEQQLFEVLEEELAANQFCREGHWIIDKFFMPSNTFIRGECNESATQADRDNFPNTIQRW